MSSSTNKYTVVLLLLGIGTCIALLPWSRWLGKSLDEKLTERINEYVQLRIEEDWIKLYGMTDPEHRRLVSIQRYLQLYGSGAIRAIALTETSRSIDAEKGEARVEMTLDGEVRLDRLPAAARSSLRLDDPSATRQSGPCSLDWKLRDGNWWVRLEHEAVTGRSRDGKPINVTGG